MPNRSLWSATNSEEIRTTPLISDQSVDLVVIGGGFTGCAAALEAASNGASVTVLEATTIAHGGSGRNVGLVNAGLWLPPEDIIAQLGEQAGTRLIDAFGQGPETVFGLIRKHGINCEAVRNGTLHLAHAADGVRDLEERYRQGNRFGAPIRLLDRNETVARTGSDQFHGALFDPRAGTIQPRAYCSGLARAAIGQGANIHENTTVTRIERRDGLWHVQANGHIVKAGRLLVATNAYHQLAQGAYAPQYVTVNYCQFATVPLTEAQRGSILQGGEGCWDTALVMTSVRSDAAGRLIVGGMGNSDGPASSIHRDWAHRKLARLYPHLSGVPFEFEWSGRIAMTSDHIPKIVAFGPDAYAVFGYSGRGISPGTVMGTAAAKALLGAGADVSPLPVVQSHEERFTTIKGAYYEFGASLTHALKPRFAG